MGAGKSTQAHLLKNNLPVNERFSSLFGKIVTQHYPELVESPNTTNPYLLEKYSPSGRFSHNDIEFLNQIKFLEQKIDREEPIQAEEDPNFQNNQNGNLINRNKPDLQLVIQDRCFRDDYEVFGNLQITQADSPYQGLYKSAYEIIKDQFTEINLNVYLEVSKDLSVERVHCRGAEEESEIERVYLDRLHTQYSHYIQKLKDEEAKGGIALIKVKVLEGKNPIEIYQEIEEKILQLTLEELELN